MSETHEIYARMQSLRINNLEEQIQLIQRELHRLRNGVLQENDVEKLINFKEKLKEFNGMLDELRTFYNSLQLTTANRKNNVLNKAHHAAKNNKANNNHLEHLSANSCSLNDEHTSQCFGRANAGSDQKEPFSESPQKEVVFENEAQRQSESVNSGDSFKTCKQLMKEIKPPSSILGNYLMRLQDFRADPELRRQRLRSKHQQQLQKLEATNHPKSSSEDKATITADEDIIMPYRDPMDNKQLESNDIKIPSRSNDNYSSSETDSRLSLQVPVISRNLSEAIESITKYADKKSIVLTLVLETDLYHLSVSHISDGRQLACFLATDEAVQEAKQQHVFQDFLTLFVVSAENAESRNNRVMGHLFEFFKIDSNTKSQVE